MLEGSDRQPPLHSERAKARHIHVSEMLAGELGGLGLNFTRMTHRLCAPSSDFLVCETETQMFKNARRDGLLGKALTCKLEGISSDPWHLRKKLDMGWEDGQAGKRLLCMRTCTPCTCVHWHTKRTRASELLP